MKGTLINPIITDLLLDYENYNNFTVIRKIQHFDQTRGITNLTATEKMILYSLQISAINQWLFEDRQIAYETLESFYATIEESNDAIELIFLFHSLKNLIENKKIFEIESIITKANSITKSALSEKNEQIKELNQIYIVRFSHLVINYYKIIKNYAKGFEECEKSINLALQTKKPFYILSTVEEIVNYICYTDTVEKLQEYEKKYYDYYVTDNNLNNSVYLIRYLFIIAEIYYWDYSKPKVALTYLDKGFDLLIGIEIITEGNLTLLSSYYAFKGIIFSNMGKNKEAIEIFREASVFDKLLQDNYNNFINLGNTYGNIGEIYYDLGNYNKALEYQDESNFLREKMTDSQYGAESYFQLILVHTKLHNKQLAFNYLTKLKILVEKWKETNIPQTNDLQSRYEIAFAYVLKEKKTFKDNNQALQLLQPWVNSNLRPDLKLRALIPLIELTIQEFKFDQNEATFGNIHKQVNILDVLVQDFNSIPLKIQALILKGKIELIIGNYKSFEQFFVNARNLAEEYDLKIAETWIQDEIMLVQKEMNKWEYLLTNNKTLKERLDAIDMEQYITELQQLLEGRMQRNT